MGAIIIKLIIGAVLVAAFGGQGGPAVDEGMMFTGDAEIDKMLDEMKFENAPTLGPFIRRCMVATYKGDGAFLWDNLDFNAREAMQWQFEAMKENMAGIDKQIRMIEDAISNAATKEEKERLRKSTDMLKAMKEKLPEMKDGRDYFIFTVEQMAKMRGDEMKKEFLAEPMQVIGEEIARDDRSGGLILKDLKTGQKKKVIYLREDGQWRHDAMVRMQP